MKTMKSQPLLPFNSKRQLRRRMPSGLEGWVARLRANYVDFAEWHYYSGLRGLSERLGYKSVVAAWRANPIICGSVKPADYGRYRSKK